MVETYKYKSKIATAISFIAALIAYLGKDGLTEIMPAEYAFLIPILIFAAGYVLAQKTEDKRVDVAEQMVLEKIAKDDTPETADNTDVVAGDEDVC
ncbi:hypothetical protein [Methanobrevibacter sp.]|uniref:hypothetical protein n=1 Tax=Methanobrevibacter sp. TaxID=66852 RepID=UPI00388FD42D